MPPPPEVVPVTDPPLAVLSQDSQKQAPLMRSWNNSMVLEDGENQELQKSQTENSEELQNVEVMERSIPSLSTNLGDLLFGVDLHPPSRPIRQ
ncbi:hypothetical protein DY000_02020934 [Brassica cretica]|uniref:Uncharacterized protein n=1 Tax=Brassica cretica TaxID=69181 RepID=A0ABQ7E2A1_BRACR|nr:hypothetical protein DY000_02020934 [Brassica cretica]